MGQQHIKHTLLTTGSYTIAPGAIWISISVDAGACTIEEQHSLTSLTLNATDTSPAITYPSIRPDTYGEVIITATGSSAIKIVEVR